MTTGRADPAYSGEPMATAASAVPGGFVDLALEGCTVIVTGAGSGIGAATARQHRPLPAWEADGFDEQVATNVRAPYFLIQAALPASGSTASRPARSIRRS